MLKENGNTAWPLWLTLLALVGLFWANPVQAKSYPEFSLAWSEYPSWSAFGVAHELKLIDGRKGHLGTIERKWKIDIVLKEADYDTCLVMYGAGQSDAVCITNMDVLNPSLARPSVVILPTSTSHGADALIVAGGIVDIKQLRGKKIYGLAKTVSEYLFARNLELLGEKEADYQFTNMDPGAAAVAMQQNNKGYDAIVVWNPFVLETLNRRKDARILFDSTRIPGEIIDLVAVSKDSLEKSGGEAFACALIDVFYAINLRLADPAHRDETLVMLGQKFSNLNLQSMRQVVKQTRFYETPEQGMKILTAAETRDIMTKVIRFCVSHEIVPQAPVIAYAAPAAAPGASLWFDPSYIQKAGQGPPATPSP